MLKGHVFSKQLFENPIFALFVNTFLNGNNGVSDSYKNGMELSYSGSNVTIQSGAVCIQGRFLEEDSYTTISAGTNSLYCKLVIEIDLDKENTESEFNQGAYKIITSTTSYPSLTQTDIVNNVSGVYQYELARFKTTSSGISDFQDMRTFLNFDSIYTAIKTEYSTILESMKTEYNKTFEELQESLQEALQELRTEISNVEDGSAYLLKTDVGVAVGRFEISSGYGAATLEYPEGFGMDNCVIISVLTNGSAYNMSSYDVYANTATSGVKVEVTSLISTGSVEVDVFLMKSNSIVGW